MDIQRRRTNKIPRRSDATGKAGRVMFAANGGDASLRSSCRDAAPGGYEVVASFPPACTCPMLRIPVRV